MNEPVLSATTMRWASAHSRLADPSRAIEEIAAALLPILGDGPVDLALAFFSPPFVAQAEMIRAGLARALSARCLAGVSGAGVITRREEIESGHALSVIAARLPGVAVSSFILPGSARPGTPMDADLLALAGDGIAESEIALVFGDPFTLDAEGVIEALGRRAPGARMAGGLASAGHGPGRNALFLNDWTSPAGGIVVALGGALRADLVVSQDCRPIGDSLAVTRADRNLLLELDGRPALGRVQEVLRGLARDELDLVRNGGLLAGRPVRDGASGRGDYVIRNIIGHDPQQGAIAIADQVSAGERIRLHVRDARTAREDLQLLLIPQLADGPAAAALAFSCNGRGSRLFSEPHGDISVIQSALGGSVAAAGLFCAGEIGPIGGRNFLHGHTVSLAIIRPR